MPDYARFICPSGTSTFSIHKQQTLPSGEGVWVYFEVENVDEKIDLLLKQAIKIEELPEDKAWLWREARLKDLDNNQLIIYQAGDYRINPPWRINR